MLEPVFRWLGEFPASKAISESLWMFAMIQAFHLVFPGSSCCAAKMILEAGKGMARIICWRLPYGLAAGPVAAGAAGWGAGAEVQAANNSDDARRAQALFIDFSSGSGCTRYSGRHRRVHQLRRVSAVRPAATRRA